MLLAGSCVTRTVADFCALRLDSNADLDLSVNGTGKLITARAGRANGNATRKTWPLIRDDLVAQFGMSLAP